MFPLDVNNSTRTIVFCAVKSTSKQNASSLHAENIARKPYNAATKPQERDSNHCKSPAHKILTCQTIGGADSTMLATMIPIPKLQLTITKLCRFRASDTQPSHGLPGRVSQRHPTRHQWAHVHFTQFNQKHRSCCIETSQYAANHHGLAKWFEMTILTSTARIRSSCLGKCQYNQ